MNGCCCRESESFLSCQSSPISHDCPFNPSKPHVSTYAVRFLFLRSLFPSLTHPPPPPREFSCVMARPAGSSEVILCLRGGRRGEGVQLPPSPHSPPPGVNFQIFLPDHPPPRPPPSVRGGGEGGGAKGRGVGSAARGGISYYQSPTGG